ncbi:MAG: hypothetical protein GX370_03490 [Clostridia bacterium]|jgi:hypothetical protein|nr:hypothetical protein [Clostridia bacterium]
MNLLLNLLLTIFIVIFALLALLIILLTFVPFRITARFSSESQQGLKIIITSLKGSIKGTIIKENPNSFIKVYLFNNNFYTKELSKIITINKSTILKLKDYYNNANFTSDMDFFNGSVDFEIFILPFLIMYVRNQIFHKPKGILSHYK